MITVISPSKSIMKQDQPADLHATDPLFQNKTTALVTKLQKLNQQKLTKTLQVSDSLGKLNYDRYQAWDTAPQRAALWMYSGDVYNGVDAYTMTKDQIAYAQDTLLIVSGLYGLVRPLDAVQPYRLEMKLPFGAGKAKNLYDYWRSGISRYLKSSGEDIVLLCASPEYTQAIKQSLPENIKTITPRFMQKTTTGLKEKGLFAKYARGALARWVIDNKISNPNNLKNYTGDGFTYSAKLSSDVEAVFLVPKNFSLKGRFIKK